MALTAKSGVEMTEHSREISDQNNDAQLAVGMRVRVYPGTDAEGRGVVVDDCGQAAGYPVEIGGNHIADPARGWAVVLDTGDLVSPTATASSPNNRGTGPLISSRPQRASSKPERAVGSVSKHDRAAREYYGATSGFVPLVCVLAQPVRSTRSPTTRRTS